MYPPIARLAQNFRSLSFSFLPEWKVLAGCDEIARFPFSHFGHFHSCGFLSDFGFRISDFRRLRSASFASLRLMLLVLAACLPARLGANDAHNALADQLFSSKEIPHLAIEISAADLAVLRSSKLNMGGDMGRSNVMATIREGPQVYTNVAVHLKGSRGSFRGLDGKPGFTLHFNKFVEGQCFHGLQKISLNNSVQDSSYLCEMLGRQMFNAAGVPVPRVTHATVDLNGRHLGVFVLVEGYDKPFLKRHFKDAGGNFYEADPSNDIDGNLEVKSGDHPKDRIALDRLIVATRENDSKKRWEALERSLDLDRFITGMALETMIGHWDGYCGNLNNYRIFHDRQQDKLVFLPHGMDQLFGMGRSRRRDPALVPRMRGSVAAAVIETEEGRRRYLTRLAELQTNVFNVREMTNEIVEVSARLRPLLTNDVVALAYFDGTLGRLLTRVPERYETVRDQLANVAAGGRATEPETTIRPRRNFNGETNQLRGPRRGLRQAPLQQN
jgi:spore coat protein H